jgi:hydrogen peroxide-dependent heme synthase
MKDELHSKYPPVPLTLEGSYILHQMFGFRRAAWKKIDEGARRAAVEQAQTTLAAMEQSKQEPSALFSLLGHKGDLLFIHFRRTLEALNAAELAVANLDLGEFIEPTTSYLSVVELGMYEATVRLYQGLKDKGLQPDSTEWNQAVAAELENQKKMVAPRLFTPIPARRYVCFYPMNKLRGETKNWYSAPIEERQKMMADHGIIGRKYAGQVTQVISGSIGFDDWEWGVDLFADDPLVFKKLVYEMRFDEASAVYGQFGAFYVGIRLPAEKLPSFLDPAA